MIDRDVYSTKWDFAPGEVNTPARLWIGTEDRSVPAAAALKLAADLGNCLLSKLDRHGHFWILEHAGEVLDWLAATVGASLKTNEPAARPPQPAR